MRQPASSLDLFTDSVRIMGDATLLSVMELERHLDLPRLRSAWSMCLDAFPILTSKLVREGGPAYWEYLGRMEGDDEIEMHSVEGDDYRPMAIMPRDPYRPPQARVRVIRSKEDDILIISLAHAAADGFGIKHLSNALLQAYADPALAPPPSKVLPVRDTLWTAALHDGAVAAGGLEIVNPMWPSPCPSSSAPSTFHRADIPSDKMERVRSQARCHGGTVNDALMAAYFLSLSDLTGHYGPQPLFFPVDLRRYLPPGSRVMTNQAINVSFMLTRDKGEDMSSLLGKVVRETAQMKAGRIGINEMVAFDRRCDPSGESVQRMVEAMHGMEKKGWADLFMSNPGPFDLPPFPGLRHAYVCYPGGYMPTTCFVMSSYRGTMTVTMGYQDDPRPREATYQAMRGFLDHLSLKDVEVL